MTLRIRSDEPRLSLAIRVRGRVQGVGFRPAVWRLARELGVCGEVLNDAEGVLIRASGVAAAVTGLIEGIRRNPPPLARIETIETEAIAALPEMPFRIATTVDGVAQTQVAPDAAICAACAREILDPRERRYRYPFANCTHCGPRLTIVSAIPYDRSNTTMDEFELCASCNAEYRDPADRRFHAEAIACAQCGPGARLVRVHDGAVRPWENASALLKQGQIVAIKSLGGYQLACDATNRAAVRRLRESKLRRGKPFALMARDLDVIRRYCRPGDEEEALLSGAEAPIVLMRATGPEFLTDDVAPGLCTLGFMLPITPLHLLLLRDIDRPIVMTSGNLSEEPQIIGDEEALERFAAIADYVLAHNRRIAARVDDSVVRVVAGSPRLIRRARGYAPGLIKLPAGFEKAPDILAMGGDLKSAFCLLKDGEAALSQHQGNLENPATFDDYRANLSFYAGLFDHMPKAIAIDLHPEYFSAKYGRESAGERALPLIGVQHHHAHIAACLAENERPLDAPPVLGIALDGIGWGSDETLWGGEFLLADYRNAQRLGCLKPVAMIGGDRAAREPWRNLYAHLMAEMGWAEFAMNFAELELYRYLAKKPRALLDAMLHSATNSLPASSCGRLFDAFAAGLDLCREWQSYEGEAASRLEALVDDDAMMAAAGGLAYPFTIPNLRGSGMPYLEPLAMWKAMLGDLILQTPPPVMAARFHEGLARGIAAMTVNLARRDTMDGPLFDTVALSGGCFQNAVLFGAVVRHLTAEKFSVLTHSNVPANDGGLALGQAAVAAARLIGNR